MSVNTGTRPGTTVGEKYPGWDYVLSKGPGWDVLRKDQRLTRLFEDGVNTAIAATEKALASLYIAQIMLHGGHVDRGAMAKSGLRRDMEPSTVISHIQRLLPDEIKALVKKK